MVFVDLSVFNKTAFYDLTAKAKCIVCHRSALSVSM